MKYFKKFFNFITNTGKKIYNSKHFEIAAFVFDSITSIVDWAKETSKFIDQMKLVVASLAIVGKHIIHAIANIGHKNHSTIKSIT